MSCPAAWAKRTRLPPTGDAPIDEPRIAVEADFRPETEALCYTRTKTFDQGIGMVDQLKRLPDRSRIFQVEGNGFSVTKQQVISQGALDPQIHRLRPVDAQYLGAHIRKQHRGHRSGADASQFDDLQASKWSHFLSPHTKTETAASLSGSFKSANRVQCKLRYMVDYNDRSKLLRDISI